MRNCSVGLVIALSVMAACASGAKDLKEDGAPAPESAHSAPHFSGSKGVDSDSGGAQGILPLGDKQWTCTAKLLETEIREFGKTKGDAKHAVREKCEASHAADACKKISCNRNI